MLNWIQENIAVAVATGFLLALASFVFNIFQSIVSHKQNKRLEEVKNSLIKEQTKLNSALSTFSTESQATMEKRLNGLEKSWEYMFKLKGEVMEVISFYGLITPHEYDYEDVRQKFLSNIPTIDQNSILKTASEQLNKDRIYLGEEFYVLCRTYHSFLGRLAFNTKSNLEKGVVKAWTEDNHLLSMLGFILSNEKKVILRDVNPMSIYTVLDQCETKILSVGRKIISGEKTALDNYEILKRYEENVGIDKRDAV